MTLEKEERSEKVSYPGKTRSQVIVNSANIIDNADGQLFPTVINQVQESLGLSLNQIGNITLIKSLLQSVSSPMWGWLSDKHSRTRILSIGCFVWAFFTILIAFTVSYVDLLIYRLLIGIGLAVIVPTAQSILADYFPPAKRGKAFGWLGLTGVIGVVFGTLFATVMVGFQNDLIPGLDNWRFVFLIWGFISAIIGACVLIFAKDPIRGQTEPELQGVISKQTSSIYKIKREDFKEVFTKQTFLLIMAQGVAGSIPWNGILLMVTWLEYVGFSPMIAGLLFAVVAVGAAIGNLLGGYIGDFAAKRSPNKGRLIIAQISVFSGIPLTYIIFLVVPMATSSAPLYLIFGILTGILISWCSPGCNTPIFSEIFEPEMRSTIYSVDRLFEGSAASLGAFLVTRVATLYGYSTPNTKFTISQLPLIQQHTNAVALANGMFWVAFVPWIICLILYTLVYFTYPKDRDNTRAILIKRRNEMKDKINQGDIKQEKNSNENVPG